MKSKTYNPKLKNTKHKEVTKKKEKVYHNMDEVQKEFFPNMTTIMVSKEEEEWIERNSPYRRRVIQTGVCPVCKIPEDICLHSKFGKAFMKKLKENIEKEW